MYRLLLFFILALFVPSVVHSEQKLTEEFGELIGRLGSAAMVMDEYYSQCYANGYNDGSHLRGVDTLVYNYAGFKYSDFAREAQEKYGKNSKEEAYHQVDTIKKQLGGCSSEKMKQWFKYIESLYEKNINDFHAIADEPSYDNFSRCFFVYAPIFETGKKLQNQALFIYGQKRLAWAGGYVQAKKGDTIFSEVFERDLETNKKNAIILEERLNKAIKSGDSSTYIQVMNVARTCDKQLGLPSNDIPPP